MNPGTSRQSAQRLPPEPAPVARDANPWPWPARANPPSARRAAPRQGSPLQRAREDLRAAAAGREEALRRASTSPTTSPTTSPRAAPTLPAGAPLPAPTNPAAQGAGVRAGPRRRRGAARFVPVGVALIVIGIIASGALDAVRDGAGLEALAPLLIFLAFVVVNLLGQRRRDRRED